MPTIEEHEPRSQLLPSIVSRLVIQMMAPAFPIRDPCVVCTLPERAVAE
jgi:hypothetical protein